MNWLVAILAALSAACLASAAWLGLRIAGFFHSADYAPGSAQQPGYTAGGVDADGHAIFAPAWLLFFAGLFLARFAWNVWRAERRRGRGQ